MLAHAKTLPVERDFFFNDTATTEIYTLSLHDALPISCLVGGVENREAARPQAGQDAVGQVAGTAGGDIGRTAEGRQPEPDARHPWSGRPQPGERHGRPGGLSSHRGKATPRSGQWRLGSVAMR